MKTAKDYMTAADAVVERISLEDALTKHGAENTVFVDVRDSGDIAKTGTVAGAVRINRGFLEFAADDNTQYHNANLTKDAHLYLLCAAGGQAALAGKTLKDMGYQDVYNIGGFGAWKDAGGPVENG